MIDLIRTDLAPPHLGEIAMNALVIMEEYKIFQIPIISNENQFLGLVEESIIMNMENLQESLNLVKHQFKNISISNNTHFFQIIKIFNEQKLSLIPVVNETNSYLGYLLPCDIIHQISRINQSEVNAQIMIIALNHKDYTLQEITRLVEENNGKIMSLFSEIKENKIELHLLINCTNSKRIIQTFQRHEYTIIKTFSTNMSTNNLDDRFESFMRYLNP